MIIYPTRQTCHVECIQITLWSVHYQVVTYRLVQQKQSFFPMARCTRLMGEITDLSVTAVRSVTRQRACLDVDRFDLWQHEQNSTCKSCSDLAVLLSMDAWRFPCSDSPIMLFMYDHGSAPVHIFPFLSKWKQHEPSQWCSALRSSCHVTFWSKQHVLMI